MICFTPFASRKPQNYSLMKQETFPDIIISGGPNCAKNLFKCSIAKADVDWFMGNASIHLEWVSMNTRIIFPNNIGPATSKCNLAHGQVGHLHSCSGVTGGMVCCILQAVEEFKLTSISLFILGYLTYILAGPSFLSLKNDPHVNTAFLAFGGTITRDSQSTQPAQTDSSVFLDHNGVKFSSHLLGQP